jgi:hypothetical protein
MPSSGNRNDRAVVATIGGLNQHLEAADVAEGLLVEASG